MATTERRLEYMPLDELRDAERNPKRHNIEGVKAALRTFGVADVIGIVDERTGRLVGGHGRSEALRDLLIEGVSAPDGIRVKGKQWLVPVFRGWTSKDDAEADAVIIALNQQTISAGFDEEILSAMVAVLDAAAFSFDAIGFSAEEWDAHMAAFSILDGREPAEPRPIDPDGMYVECPNCQHRFVP